jgi:hypothetical protein
MGTSPSANYQTMEATKADALSMIAEKLATWDSWASQYGKDASGTPAPVPAPYQNVTNICARHQFLIPKSEIIG